MRQRPFLRDRRVGRNTAGADIAGRGLIISDMASKKRVLTSSEIEQIRAQAAQAIAPLKPPDKTLTYQWGDSRTNSGGNLPPYYLVHFLLVDLLKFPRSGKWEKVAWTVPVDFNGSAAIIEHRKMGLGVFSAKGPGREATARDIVAAVKRGVGAAGRYFDHLAAMAITGSQLNVTNNSPWLFGRYTYLRDLFKEKTATLQHHALYDVDETEIVLESGRKVKSYALRYSASEEAKWVGVAAIEAFFSWTEHVLILVGILLGKLRTGAEVSAMAEAEWSEKIKAAIDLSVDKEMKEIYEELLDIRRQVRNYMAHGAFGKQGEAFHFHSGAGAVPIQLSGQLGGISAWIRPSFEESRAIEVMESFIAKLWDGVRAPARLLLKDAELPIILSHASDGIYSRAMSSEATMEDYVQYLGREVDDAANMDW